MLRVVRAWHGLLAQAQGLAGQESPITTVLAFGLNFESRSLAWSICASETYKFASGLGSQIMGKCIISSIVWCGRCAAGTARSLLLWDFALEGSAPLHPKTQRAAALAAAPILRHREFTKMFDRSYELVNPYAMSAALEQCCSHC